LSPGEYGKLKEIHANDCAISGDKRNNLAESDKNNILAAVCAVIYSFGWKGWLVDYMQKRE